ncbi:MAG: TrmB family transcriptional regulator [Cellulosilyticaceae bacterium]
MTFQESLLKLGFTPIEATVYTTLSKHGALSGYEVAKICGISRSNVYAALYSLQEKGRCYVAEEDATKYIPLTKDELLATARAEFDEVLENIDSQFPETITAGDPYITIKGYETVLHKIKHTILSCESHLYLLSPEAYVRLFEKELLKICESKRVTIICDSHITVGSSLIYMRGKSPQGFHMIVDTHAVITGEITDHNSQCLFTTNQSLVRLMRESFITELDMIHLTIK